LAIWLRLEFSRQFLSLRSQPRLREAISPFWYWSTIVATTTVGTTLADFADRSLGIGYAGGTTLLFALLMAPC